MLNNLVNRQDAYRVARKVASLDARAVLEKLRVRGRDRVREHWSTVDSSSSEWWAIPAVVRRWNLMKTGDPGCTFQDFVAARYLSGRSPVSGLSLGCGTGANEALWARTGAFSSLKGVDISPERVGHASRSAEVEGLEEVLTFETADVDAMLERGPAYDVVLGLQSLHHFDDLTTTIPRLGRFLRSGGVFVADEFVGPTRFQWTEGQVEVANELLARLPEDRRRTRDGRLKRRADRPSRLAMLLDDPSEAVDSSSLLPAIRASFEILEERPYGGTVLHIALSGIAHNFLADDPATRDLLDLCFEIEDAALPELGHDFVAVVARRGHAALAPTG